MRGKLVRALKLKRCSSTEKEGSFLEKIEQNKIKKEKLEQIIQKALKVKEENVLFWKMWTGIR